MIPIQIAIIVILIVLSALFSSSETALTTISPHRLRSLVDEEVSHAKILEKILGQKDKMLSVILICNNIVNLTASALATVVVQKLFGNRAVSIGTGVLTLLVLIFGEIVPKTMATKRAEKMGLAVAPVINVLMIGLISLRKASFSCWVSDLIKKWNPTRKTRSGPLWKSAMKKGSRQAKKRRSLIMCLTLLIRR